MGRDSDRQMVSGPRAANAPTGLTHIAPPCPECGAPLAPDGGEHLCRRCARAFTVTVEGAGSAGAYREAPVFALVPVPEVRPRHGLCDATEARGALDFSVGSAWLPGHRLSTPAAVLGSVLGFLTSILCVVVLYLSEVGTIELGSWFYALVVSMLASVAADVLSFWLRSDRLSIEGDRLVWRRLRGLSPGSRVLAERSVELTRIVGARDAGTDVRVELDDGTAWTVGEGMKVPDGVRRWAAARIGELVAPALTSDTRPERT